MNIFDWKLCLGLSMWMFIVGLFTGDIVGLFLFLLFYLVALQDFDREVRNANINHH